MDVKKIIVIIVMILVIIFLARFMFGTGSEGTVDNHAKQGVNFYGTLLTYQGVQYKVENIVIDKKYRQIRVMDCPGQDKMPQGMQNEKTHKNEIILTVDPHLEFPITLIDLVETKEIHAIPEPLYVFRPEKHRALEFVSIDVISNDTTKTHHRYLIDHNSKLYCDEINEAGPIEKEIPIAAIDRLIIEGFSQRTGVTEGVLVSGMQKTNNSNVQKMQPSLGVTTK